MKLLAGTIIGTALTCSVGIPYHNHRLNKITEQTQRYTRAVTEYTSAINQGVVVKPLKHERFDLETKVHFEAQRLYNALK